MQSSKCGVCCLCAPGLALIPQPQTPEQSTALHSSPTPSPAPHPSLLPPPTVLCRVLWLRLHRPLVLEAQWTLPQMVRAAATLSKKETKEQTNQKKEREQKVTSQLW